MQSPSGRFTPDPDPIYVDPSYAVTLGRGPLSPPVTLSSDWFETLRGPLFGGEPFAITDTDLTLGNGGAPLGERIFVFGTVSDGERPLPDVLVEIWQANASGRYVDPIDPWGQPLDANFTGAGRCRTDAQGRYRFTTIKPAAYPTFYTPGNQGWRAAHIHFSVFGPGFDSRLITQMYFEGDPLLRQDAIFGGAAEFARDRLVAKIDLAQSFVDVANAPGLLAPLGDPDAPADVRDLGRNQSALAYRFDIVLRGRRSVPVELVV